MTNWLPPRNGETFIKDTIRIKARKDAVANFRFKTGENCLAAHLKNTGIIPDLRMHNMSSAKLHNRDLL